MSSVSRGDVLDLAASVGARLQMAYVRGVTSQGGAKAIADTLRIADDVGAEDPVLGKWIREKAYATMHSGEDLTIEGTEASPPAARELVAAAGAAAPSSREAAEAGLRAALRRHGAACDLVESGRALVGPTPNDGALIEDARVAAAAWLDACTAWGATEAELDAICAEEANRVASTPAAS